MLSRGSAQAVIASQKVALQAKALQRRQAALLPDRWVARRRLTALAATCV